jgi:hypothetical protein
LEKRQQENLHSADKVDPSVKDEEALDEITGAEMEMTNDFVVSHIDELRRNSGLGTWGKPCNAIALLSIGWDVQYDATCGQ